MKSPVMVILSWKHFGFTWETVQSALREIPLDIYLVDNAATKQKRDAFAKLESKTPRLHYRPLEKNWGTVAYNKLFEELGKDHDYLTSSNDVLFPEGWWKRFSALVEVQPDDVGIMAPFSVSYFMEEPIGKELMMRYTASRRHIQKFPKDEPVEAAQNFTKEIYEPWGGLEKAAANIERAVKCFSPPRPERGDVLYWPARGLQTFGGFNEEWGPMATEHEVFTRCHICGLRTALIPTYVHHSVNISTRYWDKDNRLEPWDFPECPFPPARMRGDKSAIFNLRREKLREWGSFGIYTCKQNGQWYILDRGKFVPVGESRFLDEWPEKWRGKVIPR